MKLRCQIFQIRNWGPREMLFCFEVFSISENAILVLITLAQVLKRSFAIFPKYPITQQEYAKFQKMTKHALNELEE